MPRRIIHVLVALTLALAMACGGDDDDTPPAGTGAGTLMTPTEAVTSSDDKPTAAPTPAPDEISVANESFSVETPDGVVLRGHAYTPDGPKRQALVIVAPVDQSIWAESTQAFTSEGVAVFTFDMRGFGETGGGEADAETRAADTRLVTRFVMSREYPLVYLFGVGAEGAQASVEAAGTLDALSGLVTYGFAGEATAPTHVSIGGDGIWDGENVLAVEAVREAVLEFVLRN